MARWKIFHSALFWCYSLYIVAYCTNVHSTIWIVLLCNSHWVLWRGRCTFLHQFVHQWSPIWSPACHYEAIQQQLQMEDWGIYTGCILLRVFCVYIVQYTLYILYTLCILNCVFLLHLFHCPLVHCIDSVNLTLSRCRFLYIAFCSA